MNQGFLWSPGAVGKPLQKWGLLGGVIAARLTFLGLRAEPSSGIVLTASPDSSKLAHVKLK